MELWNKFDIHHPSEWGSISIRSIKQNKGQSIIRIHGGSLYKALVFAFPGNHFVAFIEKNWSGSQVGFT